MSVERFRLNAIGVLMVTMLQSNFGLPIARAQVPDSTEERVRIDDAKLADRIERLEREVKRLRQSPLGSEASVRSARSDSKLAERRFKAIHYGEATTAIGDFTIDGPIASTLHPVRGVSKIAYDAERNRLFGRSHHDVYLVSKNEKPILIEQDPELEEMSWLSAIAYDVNKERLLASTFGGGGFLYAYYPDRKMERDEKPWEIICRPGLSVSAFVHAPTLNRLFGISLSTGIEPITKVYEFNMNGARLATRELSEPIANADGYGATQMVWLDGWLFVIQSKPTPVRGYLIDPSTGVIHHSTELVPHESDMDAE